MTTVTLKTDEGLLARAEAAMARQNLSLDDVWKEALLRIAADDERLSRFDMAMEQLRHFDTGGPFTRDEMNER